MWRQSNLPYRGETQQFQIWVSRKVSCSPVCEERWSAQSSPPVWGSLEVLETGGVSSVTAGHSRLRGEKPGEGGWRCWFWSGHQKQERREDAVPVWLSVSSSLLWPSGEICKSTPSINSLASFLPFLKDITGKQLNYSRRDKYSFLYSFHQVGAMRS